MGIWLSNLALMNPISAAVTFVLMRIVTVVVPPFLGVVIDTPAIVIFGWWQGFLLAETGIMIGAMIAFSIARFFREPIIKHVVSLKHLEQWEKKLSESQTFWTLVAIRIPTFSVFDVINYAAGLTHIKTKTFFFATLIGSLPSMFLFFFIGEQVFSGKIFFIAGVLSFVIAWLIFRHKKTPVD